VAGAVIRVRPPLHRQRRDRPDGRALQAAPHRAQGGPGGRRQAVAIPPYYVDVAGADLLAVARENHLEAVVAKRLSSRYTPGRRSRDWVKTPLRTTIEVVVCGATPGEGQHAATFGSLVLGVHDLADGRLRYIGNVGSGFSEQDPCTLRGMLDEHSRADAPFDELPPPAAVAGARWVTPELVGGVAYRDWIRPEHRLRHPSGEACAWMSQQHR
jgi:bifunctional non-homologous end joining protein LigD